MINFKTSGQSFYFPFFQNKVFKIKYKLYLVIITTVDLTNRLKIKS